jgi:hypothetical protein
VEDLADLDARSTSSARAASTSTTARRSRWFRSCRPGPNEIDAAAPGRGDLNGADLLGEPVVDVNPPPSCW